MADSASEWVNSYNFFVDECVPAFRRTSTEFVREVSPLETAINVAVNELRSIC